MKIFIYYPLKRGGFKPKFFGNLDWRKGIGNREQGTEKHPNSTF